MDVSNEDLCNNKLHRICHRQQQSEHHEEKEKLLNDIQQLKNELQKSKETIVRLQKSEEQMRER